MDWLAFSLSNQPGFLDSFNSTVPTANQVVAIEGGAVEHGEEEGNGGGSSSSDLALAGPKLENFLGGCGEPPPDDHGGGMYHSGRKTSLTSGLLSDYLSDRLESDCSKAVLVQTEPKKSADTFGQRTSIYRGVTRHRWTGRYEAHLWDNSCRREGQSRKGRQVYLGGYDKEEKAARAYDLAAIKYWGPTTNTNFLMPNYENEIVEMKNMTRQEFVASLRRKSSGFSRGASIYRGVTRHHQHGRWQARIGRVAGNKDLYLGTFSSQEEAAEAYDIAAIKFRGLNAVTNFDMSRYDVKCIAKSNLPIGGMSGRTSNSKNVVSPPSPPDQSPSSSCDTKGRTVNLAYGLAMQQQEQQKQQQEQQKQQQEHDYWSFLALHQQTIQQGGSSYRDNNNNPYFNAFPSGANMDLSPGATTAADAEGKNGSYMWNCSGGGDDGVYIMQHSGEQTQTQQDDEEEHEKTNRNSSGGVCCSTIPYATPNALVSGYENENGSWVMLQPSSNHAYPQTATKTNMGVFQTPIFGME